MKGKGAWLRCLKKLNANIEVEVSWLALVPTQKVVDLKGSNQIESPVYSPCW